MWHDPVREYARSVDVVGMGTVFDTVFSYQLIARNNIPLSPPAAPENGEVLEIE